MCGGGREHYDIAVHQYEELQEEKCKFMHRVALWHGALQAQFERETFGKTLYEAIA